MANFRCWFDGGKDGVDILIYRFCFACRPTRKSPRLTVLHHKLIATGTDVVAATTASPTAMMKTTTTHTILHWSNRPSEISTSQGQRIPGILQAVLLVVLNILILLLPASHHHRYRILTHMCFPLVTTTTRQKLHPLCP